MFTHGTARLDPRRPPHPDPIPTPPHPDEPTRPGLLLPRPGGEWTSPFARRNACADASDAADTGNRWLRRSGLLRRQRWRPRVLDSEGGDEEHGHDRRGSLVVSETGVSVRPTEQKQTSQLSVSSPCDVVFHFAVRRPLGVSCLPSTRRCRWCCHTSAPVRVYSFRPVTLVVCSVRMAAAPFVRGSMKCGALARSLVDIRSTECAAFKELRYSPLFIRIWPAERARHGRAVHLLRDNSTAPASARARSTLGRSTRTR